MDKTLIVNLKWNLQQVAVQFRHAVQVKGRAKSGYYKVAIILIGSVAEALVHQLLLKNKHLEMPLQDWECAEHSILPEHYAISKDFKLAICKRVQKRFVLESHSDFSKVIYICYQVGIIKKSLRDKLNKVRKIRNKIHLQGLDNFDRSYTRGQLEFVSKVVLQLVELLDN